MTENFGDAETLAAIVSAGLCVGASTGDRHAAWSALSMLRGLAESTRAPAVETPHCWHCLVQLIPEALTCGDCPSECDDEDCEDEGCLRQRETHPGVVPRAEAAVEEVELAEAKWIRCEERMPEPTDRVWFVVDRSVNKGGFDGEEFVNVGMISWAAKDVTHWMHRPLEPARPAPPKETTRDE